MKQFSYTWTADFYLLHLQFDCTSGKPYVAKIRRDYQGNPSSSDKIEVLEGVKSHRVMVSRTHPKETSFLVEYPPEVVLEVYELDDRAYYPTKAFFIG